MSPPEISFAVCLLVGRDLAAPSQCCRAGELCRHEVRIACAHESDEFGARMWKRLEALGLQSLDYGRILRLPSDNVLPYHRRQADDEWFVLKLKEWREQIRARSCSSA